MISCAISVSLASLLHAGDSSATPVPATFPLVHIEVGQDAEDAESQVFDYYAHIEAYSITYAHNDENRDDRGRALASEIRIGFEPHLQAEIHDLPVGESSPGIVEYPPLRAPGEGWIIEASFHVPHSNVVIFTAQLGQQAERLLFYRIAIGAGIEKLAEIDTRRAPGPHQLANGWWNLEMRPAAIGGRRSPDREKPFGPRIFFEQVPPALEAVFPPPQAYAHDDGWWGDGVRDEDRHHLAQMHRVLSDAVTIFDFSQAAVGRVLLRRYLEGGYRTPEPEELYGEWGVRAIRPRADGDVVVNPWFDATIEADVGTVFRKTSGSQRREGRLYRDFAGFNSPSGLVFLGAKFAADEPAPVYSGWLLPDLRAAASDSFGRLFGLSSGHLLLILDVRDAGDWEIYELKAAAPPKDSPATSSR